MARLRTEALTAGDLLKLPADNVLIPSCRRAPIGRVGVVNAAGVDVNSAAIA